MTFGMITNGSAVTSIRVMNSLENAILHLFINIRDINLYVHLLRLSSDEHPGVAESANSIP